MSQNNINQLKSDNTLYSVGQMGHESNAELIAEPFINDQQGELNDESSENSETIQYEIENNLKNANLNAGNSIYVSDDGDDDSGDGSENNPYKTIDNAINKSSNESTIYLSNGSFNGLNLTINKTLTIKGNENTIIDGQSSSRIFIMNSNAKLTLIGLTLINGFADESSETGGAIFNEGGELNLINCTIKQSTAYNGGAIYNNLGTLNIKNTNFISNIATQYGGAIYSIGQTNICESYFTENDITAEKGVGACIACAGVAFINNTLFLKNHAIYSAGAILNLGNTTINNCSFINQSTNYTGGAISNHNYMLINNSLFSGGSSRFYAAALLAPPSGQHVITEVYNTIFEKNQVGAHGAVSNNFPDTELIMKNCAIVGNLIVLEQGGKSYGDIALDDNASVLYCWWGQNEISPYYYSAHSETQEPWKINASRWLVMEFTSSNGLIEQENNNVLNVNLKHYFDNETKGTYDYEEDINLPLTVKFYTNYGKTIGTATLVNGSASINYIPDANTKTVYAKIDNQTLEIAVIQKNESILTSNDMTKYYKDDKNLEVKLTDNDNNPLYNKTIKIEISGKTYTKTTNAEGIAKLAINLKAGNYSAKISFVDRDYKNQEKTVKVTVLKNKTSINASNLVKYYKNATNLNVKLLDNNNNPLKSENIKIKISGKTYTKTTNAQGIAKLAINLKPGTYSTKISFDGDANFVSSSKTINVYVKSPKLTTKTKKIHQKSYFVVTLKDKNGNAIKKTQIKFRFNGKTYTRTTDNKGVAKLKINVKLGTYNIKTSFKSTKLYGATVFTNKIKVIK